MNSNVSKYLPIVLLVGIFSQPCFHVQAQHNELHKDPYTEKFASKFSYNILTELHYNDAVDGKYGLIEQGELDFHELHFKAGYKVNKHLKIKTALEVEHVFDSQYDGGDAFFKQAYLDYHKTQKVGFKAGLVSLPVTASHSKMYAGVELAPVEKYLSYAWRELGILMYGDLSGKLSYQASVTTGLEASEISSKYGIYYARNSRLFSSINNIAAAGQLQYKLNNHLTLGTSVLYSGLESNQEYGSELKGASYTMFEGFASYKTGAVTTRIVGVYSAIAETEKINYALHEHIGSAQYGVLAELSYDFLYNAQVGKQGKHLIAYGRMEAYDTQYRTEGFEDEPKYQRQEYTLGLLYQPFKRIEIKTDYQWLRSADKSGHAQFNIGLILNL
ncbi:hypothetical protein [Gracilimonas mengyeensis]|uniref:Phosphate-selective porin O and P n=1 Tax=Gracilimonas mengyeensis TaxID=1302730 RepID=A0A521D6R0_9BACT|nr:hypothetical protein [Gracilimonas mengyeensis]SMO67374.1 hypothetical protein SAMN06265219_107162 [Gracilimonas mengyeensis]